MCVYTFLNWLLVIRLHLFLVKEEVTNLWIPFGLPWIPLYFWYLPRLRLLKFKDRDKGPTGAMLVAGWGVAVPLFLTQAYLSTASERLTALDKVRDIAQTEQTRYYIFKDYTIDRPYNASQYKKTVTGKSGQYLDLNLYIVCPIYDPDRVPLTDDRHYPVSNQPLYFLNGTLSDSSIINRLKKKDIANIYLLKGAPALARYGLAGRNGVANIFTKDPLLALDTQSTRPLPDSLSASPADDEPTKITTVGQDTFIYPLAWIGVKYSKEISNRLDADVKRKKSDDFLKESWTDYFQRPDKGFTYFDEVPYNNDYSEFVKAAQKTKRLRNETHIPILVPRTDAFENRNGHKLSWIFGSFAICATIFFLVLMAVPFDERKLSEWLAGNRPRKADRLSREINGPSSETDGSSPEVDGPSSETNRPTPEKTNEFSDTWKAFAPRQGFLSTPVIIYLNVAVFIVMVIAGLGFLDFTPTDLAAWGGNYGPYTSNSQWWRLVTATFLHGGFAHLTFNMYGLLFVGLLLEPILGRNRFAVCYLVTGILASFASFKIHPASVSVGASGAIFGMYGIFLVFLVTGVCPPGMKKAFLASTVIFIGYNLVAGLAGNADNAAHIGGLATGAIIGLALSGKLKIEKEADSG